MNNPQVYNFNGNRIRVLGTHVEPLFTAKDVADALGYTDASKMCERLDVEDDYKRINRRPGGLGVRGSVVLTESGIHAAVLRSDSPLAKAFKRWITSKVMPAIRKHGAYATPAAAEAMLNDPDVMITALRALKEERIAKVNAQLEAKEALKEKEKAQKQIAVIAKEKGDITLKLDAVTSAVKPLCIEICFSIPSTLDR